MIDESRELSVEREEAEWTETRHTVQRTFTSMQTRDERTPTYRNRPHQNQSPNRNYQQNTTLRTPRIPRNPNRYSPLRYAYQDTPYRNHITERIFFPRGHIGRPPRARREYSPHRPQGRWGPPGTNIGGPQETRGGKIHGHPQHLDTWGRERKMKNV